MTVNFDGSGSRDPNGDPLSYEWDLHGDGLRRLDRRHGSDWTYNTAVQLRVSRASRTAADGTATDALRIGVRLATGDLGASTAFRWKVGDTVLHLGDPNRQQGPNSPMLWTRSGCDLRLGDDPLPAGPTAGRWGAFVAIQCQQHSPSVVFDQGSRKRSRGRARHTGGRLCGDHAADLRRGGLREPSRWPPPLPAGLAGSTWRARPCPNSDSPTVWSEGQRH